MLPFRKNKWIGVFLDLVQEDLSHLNWTHQRNYNFNPDERQALQELKDAPKLIIKKSDKRGNFVLQFNDRSMYEKFVTNLFSTIVEELNFKLSLTHEVNLIAKK